MAQGEQHAYSMPELDQFADDSALQYTCEQKAQK